MATKFLVRVPKNFFSFFFVCVQEKFLQKRRARTTKRRENLFKRAPRDGIEVKNGESQPLLKETVIFVLAFQIAASLCVITE